MRGAWRRGRRVAGGVLRSGCRRRALGADTAKGAVGREVRGRAWAQGAAGAPWPGVWSIGFGFRDFGVGFRVFGFGFRVYLGEDVAPVARRDLPCALSATTSSVSTPLALALCIAALGNAANVNAALLNPALPHAVLLGPTSALLWDAAASGTPRWMPPAVQGLDSSPSRQQARVSSSDAKRTQGSQTGSRSEQLTLSSRKSSSPRTASACSCVRQTAWTFLTWTLRRFCQKLRRLFEKGSLSKR